MQRIVLGTLAVLAIVLSVWFFGQPSGEFPADKPKPLAEEQPLPPAVANTQNEAAPKTNPKPERKDEPLPVSENKEASSGLSEAEFLRLYNDTDFARSMPTAVLVERLEAEDPELVATYLQHMLDRIGSKDLNERGRLMFLANELRSPALIPFWGNVLDRNPKGLEDEATYLNAKEPNVEAMSLRNELQTAVRNLGLMAFKEESALDLLVSYAKKSESAFDNKYQRKEAYYAIKEVNVVQAARLLQSLPKEDPLRAALALD